MSSFILLHISFSFFFASLHGIHQTSNKSSEPHINKTWYYQKFSSTPFDKFNIFPLKSSSCCLRQFQSKSLFLQKVNKWGRRDEEAAALTGTLVC